MAAGGVLERVESGAHRHALKPRMEYQCWGHTGEVFNNPDLVTTDKYQWFQDSLRRMEPELKLGFDRNQGLWCVWRKAVHIVRCEVPEVGRENTFTYAHPVPVIVKWTAQRLKGIDEVSIVPPDETFLREIYEDLVIGAIQVDNSRWASRRLWERNYKIQQEGNAKDAQDVSDIIDEDVKMLDMSNPTRFKPSIVVPEGKSFGKL